MKKRIQKKEPLNIQCNEIKRYKEQENGKASYVIRIVDWVMNGRRTRHLIKQGFFLNNRGERFMTKIKGWSREDVLLLASKMQDILGIMAQVEPSRPPEMATPSKQEEF